MARTFKMPPPSSVTIAKITERHDRNVTSTSMRTRPCCRSSAAARRIGTRQKKKGDTPTRAARTVPVLGKKETLVWSANEGFSAVVVVHIYAQGVTKIRQRKRVAAYMSCEHESTVTSDTDARTSISSITRAGAMPGQQMTAYQNATLRRHGYHEASTHRAARR